MTSSVPTLTGAAGATLLPLLRSLGNERSEAVIASAMPDPAAPLTFGDLAVTLARLGYDVCQGDRARSRWRQAIDGAVVLLSRDGKIAAFARQGGGVSKIASDGTVVTDPEDAGRAMREARRILHCRSAFTVPLTEFDENLRHVLVGAFGLSFFINLVALAVPCLTMVVYDHVIGGAAPEILPGLAVGGGLALACLFVLRRMRALLLGAAVGRFGLNLQARVVHRLFRAPLANSGRFQVFALLARVRDAWRPVDPLSNAMSTAVFDAPFILLTLLAIAFIGGVLVIVPVLYLVFFLAVALLMQHRSRLGLQIAGAALAERDAMLAELAEKAEPLRLSGLQESWLRRFGEVTHRVTALAMSNATRAAAAQSLAYVLGTGVALATLMGGIAVVLAGDMTAGGLIAVMLLVWRIVGPAQAAFHALGRLRQSHSQRQRVEALLQSPVEADRPTRLRNAPRTVPSLRFDRVSYRAPGAGEQSLTGLSFAVEPGEIVAVLGPTGSGKTSVLEIAAGLLTPQLGIVLVDGRNLAHLDPDDWRLTVAAYVPARAHAFSADAPDNIALAAPWIGAGNAMQFVDKVWRVPALTAPMAAHLSASDDARLGMARLAAKSPSIAILDTPAAGAEVDARRAFEDFLVSCRGSRSVLFSTDDPAMARFADKVLVLNAGTVAYFGPPARDLAVGSEAR